MSRVDRVVDAVRRRVEGALPWYDAEAKEAEATRQEEAVTEAREQEHRARRTLEAYRQVHGLRRP